MGYELKGFKIALGALALRAILCRKVNFRQLFFALKEKLPGVI